MSPLSDAANRKGILAICLAMALFITNDALVKYVSAFLPAAQLIFIRGLFSTARCAGAHGRMATVVPAPGHGTRSTGRAGHDGLPDVAVSPAYWQCVSDQYGVTGFHRVVRGTRLA